jgi:hypothetical protein
MTMLGPGHHEIDGYLVDRIQDGGFVRWEVIHPDHGVVSAPPTLSRARYWIRKNPMALFSPDDAKDNT